jgi:hydrogenase maturation protein HypF
MPLPPTRRRVRAQLRGIVQGVGFRPFVHNLALELRLGGYVMNSSAGLVVEAEGDSDSIDCFILRLKDEAPPLAWIQSCEREELPTAGETAFRIRASVEAGEFSLVSPDIATCPECLRELLDPADRRYHYPFINCTRCGPRYTITEDIPYDRAKTTMVGFPLCPECRAEYEDPANRRYHAQPNACARCGPALSSTVEDAQRRLAAGEILAVKGLGGYHLACDARNESAVRTLRERKRRTGKPFAVMARDVAAAAEVCALSEADCAALASPRRPIVILPRNAAPLPEAIAPANRTLGVMLPYAPLHHLLFDGAPYSLLVMTSGNLSEEPIVAETGEAETRLAPLADGFLHHNRPIHMRADDSVVRTFEGVERVLRRSRGFAPRPIHLGRELGELLACGGELKNCFCLTKGTHAILSQHIGDLENYETLVFFEQTLANLKRLFRVTPRAVAHDLHPLYMSSNFARSLGLPLVGVQHHHAHIASCMAENALEGEVIGVAFDGTGYGTDGAIWGGEFLVAGYAGFQRPFHLRYVPLAGGDAAIREPWRAALAYLTDAIGTRALQLWQELPQCPANPVDPRSLRTVAHMMAAGVNTARSSSCGRLFDAVAALTGLRRSVTYEGQAAIELEAAAQAGEAAPYPFAFDADTLDFRPAIERIALDAISGVAAPEISARFHNTVAEAITETCFKIRRDTRLGRVCLSGGTFQNMLLLKLATRGLRQAGFEVFLHAQVPPNDGGIALGQAVIASQRLASPNPPSLDR